MTLFTIAQYRRLKCLRKRELGDGLSLPHRSPCTTGNFRISPTGNAPSSSLRTALPDILPVR